MLPNNVDLFALEPDHVKFLLITIAYAYNLSKIGNYAKRLLPVGWPEHGHLGRPENNRLGIPSGTRVYAIGDVHGRIDLLDSLLKRIDEDLAASPIDGATSSVSRRLY